jgi:RNA polymerase sigma factor (sigma-70 family)
MPTDVVAAGRRDLLLPAAVLRLASDQRLVEQVHAGSERAFEVLCDRHYRPVLAYCRHMLRSPEEAEDVVQHTFLAAYRELVGMQAPIAALRPWLYAIARHRCLSALRASRARPVDEGLEPAADHLIAEVTAREELRAILGDMAGLPADQRAALVLTELGDVSHAEIARTLGCSREKVKALAFQARSSLAAGRAARDTPCAEIREQLATRRGGALRRTVLRRHVRECPGCQAFRDTVQVQRRKLNLLLPLAPAAGLKRALISALFGSGGGVPGGAAVSAGALSGTGLVAAALATVAIPAAAIAGALTGPRDAREPAHPIARATTTAKRAAPATPSTQRPAADIRGAKQIPERRAPARANRNANDPGAPNQAAAPNQAGRASSRTKTEAVETPNAKPSEHPKPNRGLKPVTAPSAHHRITQLKPPKGNGRAKPAKPPNANAEVGRASPPQRNREPRAAEPPRTNRESTPAEPAKANGRSTAASPDSPGQTPPLGPASLPAASARASSDSTAKPADFRDSHAADGHTHAGS